VAQAGKTSPLESREGSELTSNPPSEHPRLSDLVTTPERASAYEAAGYWQGVTLRERLAEHARATPDGIAVVDREGTRRRSFGELASDAGDLASFLCDRGVGTGSVVSIQMPNCYEAVVMAVATHLLGGVINPLLTTYRSHELQHVYDAARPVIHFSPVSLGAIDFRTVVGDAGSMASWHPAHVPVGLEGDTLAFGDWFKDVSPVHVVEDLGDGEVDGDAEQFAPGRRVSEVIFTSGTEAIPKAVMHTEDTANFSMRNAYAGLGLDADDVVWMPSPIGHSTGFNYGVRFALYHGLKLVLQDTWSAEQAFGLVEAEKCTYTLAATTFLHDLVHYAEANDLRLPDFRSFGCGGAPVPDALVRAARGRGITALRVYGATEFLVATWNRPDSTDQRREQTDGLPLDGVEVSIRDEQGADCPAGQSGEVYVRGPNTCVGFFADPERTAAAFDGDGWCRSGDLGVVDDDHYLALVGRKKDMVIRGGLNIAPREIEEALIGFPEVWQAAVVGLPDSRLGERTCGCLVLRPGENLDLATVAERLQAQGFAKYKLPEILEIFDTFPMTPSGKIQKNELKRQIEAGRG
jgi:acyl-CoA synthetase (AMP-forming)/AMP-acid ligase II